MEDTGHLVEGHVVARQDDVALGDVRASEDHALLLDERGDVPEDRVVRVVVVGLDRGDQAVVVHVQVGLQRRLQPVLVIAVDADHDPLRADRHGGRHGRRGQRRLLLHRGQLRLHAAVHDGRADLILEGGGATGEQRAVQGAAVQQGVDGVGVRLGAGDLVLGALHHHRRVARVLADTGQGVPGRAGRLGGLVRGLERLPLGREGLDLGLVPLDRQLQLRDLVLEGRDLGVQGLALLLEHLGLGQCLGGQVILAGADRLLGGVVELGDPGVHGLGLVLDALLAGAGLDQGGPELLLLLQELLVREVDRLGWVLHLVQSGVGLLLDDVAEAPEHAHSGSPSGWQPDYGDVANSMHWLTAPLCHSAWPSELRPPEPSRGERAERGRPAIAFSGGRGAPRRPPPPGPG